MTADNRTVTTDALETLGSIISEKEARDAIHLAVEPVEAGTKLAVGAHVELRGGKAYATSSGDGVGIVDPFLMAEVKKGDRFWLVVYPRQITSLRHVWTHPAFEDATEQPKKQEETPVQYSERWIREFCHRIPLDYQTVLDGAAEYVRSGDSIVFGGLLEGQYVPDEFWPHYEIVTGTTVAEADRGSFFSCSC